MTLREDKIYLWLLAFQHERYSSSKRNIRFSSTVVLTHMQHCSTHVKAQFSSQVPPSKLSGGFWHSNHQMESP